MRWEGMGAGEAFYSPTIKSQSFSEPLPLAWERLSHDPASPLGGTEWLNGLELAVSLHLGQLGSDQALVH